MIVLRPRFSDILSFEFLFLLFLVSGAFKGAALVQSLNSRIDVTVLTAICGVIVGTFVFLRRSQPLNQNQARFALVFVFLVALAGISLATSSLVTHQMTLKLQKFAVFNTWAVAAPLFVMNTPMRMERLLRLFAGYSMIVVMQALVASQSTDSVVFMGAFGTEHYHALGRAAGIGGVMALGLLLAETRKTRQIILAGALACALLAVFVSSTRQALVGMIPAAICLILWLKHRRFSPVLFVRWTFITLLALASFVAVKALIFSGINLERVWIRMLAVFGLGAEGGAALVDSERPRLWMEGIELWMSHPILGTGFGSHSLMSPSGMRHPHNFFVELLAELGIVGLILGITLIAVPVRNTLGDRREGQPWSLAITQAICVLLFTCAMFSGDLTDNRLLFAFMALSLVAHVPRSTLRRVSPLDTTLPGVRSSALLGEGQKAQPRIANSTAIGE